MKIWWECIRKTSGTRLAFKTWWLLLEIVNTLGDVQRCQSVLLLPSTCSRFYSFWPLPGLHPVHYSVFYEYLQYPSSLPSKIFIFHILKKKKSVPVTFGHYLLCFPVQLEIGKIPLHAFGYSTCPHPRHTHILSTVHYWFRNKEILCSLMNYHSQYRWPIPSVT